MKSMKGMEDNQKFKDAKEKFTKKFNEDCTKEIECSWSIFKEVFLEYANYKCPICEDTLNRYDDIDHFRPKNKDSYEFLKCCCCNYIIMCSDCNRAYKKVLFPLDNDFKADDISSISKEKPLLINPRIDNIFDYFELLFLRKGESSILEIRPNKNLDKSSYEYRKAQKTIEVYGLGYCSDNEKVDGCRIDIFENHYERFIELAEAREKSKEEFLKKISKRRKAREYGFAKFIAKGQFKVL